MEFGKESGGARCRSLQDLQRHVKSIDEVWALFSAEVLLGKLEFVLDHSFPTLLLATEPSFQESKRKP